MAEEKWKKFFEFSSVEGNRTKGQCKLCLKDYKDTRGIYSNFAKHLKRMHSDDFKKMNSGEGEMSTVETPTSTTGKAASVEPTVKEKQDRFMMSITKNLIIKCGLPLCFVEQTAFREFLKDLNVKAAPLSAKKIKRVAIPMFKTLAVQSIRTELNNASYITLTIDGWSDRRCRSYLAFTGHFLDDQMIPKTCLIDFIRIKSAHTAINIQHLTEDVLENFNIKEKIFKIVTDNAANMVKAYKFGLFGTEEVDALENENNQSSDPSSEQIECDGKFLSMHYEKRINETALFE